MFKVGDKVIVYRMFHNKELGWIREMDAYINKVMTISDVNEYMKCVYFESTLRYHFPFECIKSLRKEKLKRVLCLK